MNQPRYEGRPLPRPDEEVVDQGLAFDLGTLGRRQVLRGIGAGAGLLVLGSAGVKLAGPSLATSAAGEIPDETAGPYPGDGSNGPDVLEKSGVVRSDIRSSFGTSRTRAAGVPMALTIALTNMATGRPYRDVAVYVWHCDRSGDYSMYSTGLTNENYLRGVQIADRHGRVHFTSIFPACYAGRWPHIHFEVYPDRAAITDATKAISTSQIALPQNVCDTVYATTGYSASAKNLSSLSLATDNVFGDDSATLQTPTVTGDVRRGYRVTMPVTIDPRTTPAVSAAPGGRPPSA